MTLRNLLFVFAAILALCFAVQRLAASEADTDVFFEQEPNDVSPQVLDMGSGAQPGQPVSFRVKGRIDTVDDVDRFSLDLNAGDVVGVVITDTSNVNPILSL